MATIEYRSVAKQRLAFIAAALFSLLAATVVAVPAAEAAVGSQISLPEVPGALAGTAIDAYGDFVVVGAPGEDAGAGAVYVLRRDGAGGYNLVERLTADASAQAGAGYGSAVSLNTRANGLHLAVGAPYEDAGQVDSGAAYIYKWDNGSFGLTGRATPELEAQEFGYFGAAVAVPGRTGFLIGAPGTDLGTALGSDEGLVYVVGSGGAVIAELRSGNPGVTEFGASIDAGGRNAIVGAPGGIGRAFTLSDGNNQWRVSGTIVPPVDNVGFGTSVATYGNVRAVGAPGDFGGAGSVRLHTGPGNDEFAVLDGSGSGLGLTGIGSSVALTDGIVAAGTGAGGTATAAWSRIDGVWVYDQTLTSALSPAPGFGTGLAIEATDIYVGSPLADLAVGGEGSVEVFTGTWDELPTRITAPDGNDQDGFGSSVATDGVTGVVGATDHDHAANNAGAVYVYDVTQPDPALQAELLSPDASGGDQFGYKTAVDGDILLASAPFDDATASNAGQVYVYLRNGSDWDLIDQFQAPNPAQGQRFGEALHIEQIDDGLWQAVVGAPNLGAGSAYVYYIEPFGSATPTSLAATFDSSNVPGLLGGDKFGAAVAADGVRRIAIGAPGDDDQASHAGTAYVFETTDTSAPYNYTLVDQVLPSNFGIDYDFGWSIDIEGAYLAVGAPREDVNGGNWSGAGYGFELIRGHYEEQVHVITTRGTVGGNRWGTAVGLSGDLLVVSVSGQDRYSLAGRALVRDGATWVLSEELEFEGPFGGGAVGATLALGADGTILAGNPGAATINGRGSGAVHVLSTVVPGSAPVVNVGQPTDGAAYYEGEDVTAVFTCTTGDGTQIPCDATLDGAPVTFGDDLTATVGSRSLVVSVTEGGVTTSETVNFEVLAATTPEVTASLNLSATTSEIGASAIPLVDMPAAELAGESVDISGISAATLGSIDYEAPPTGGSGTESAFAEITLGDLGLDTSAVSLELLGDIPLTEFPIDGGWEPRLVGTPYEGVPLQTVTLADVYQNENVQSVPLRFVELQETPLRFVDIVAAGFSDLPVLSIDLDGDNTTTPYDDWCAAAEAQGLTCDDLGLTATSTDVTLGAIAVAGFDIEASPLRFVPLRFVDIEASPLRFVPLRFVDIEASPLRFVPLRFVDVEASPLRFVPLRFVPLRFVPLRFVDVEASPLRFVPLRFVPLRFVPLRFVPIADIPPEDRDNVVDCAIVDCSDDSNQTIDDAILLDAYRADTATFGHLGDVLAGYSVEDVLPYLDAEQIALMNEAIAEADPELTLADLYDALGFDDITLGDIDPEAWPFVDAAIEAESFTVEELFRWIDPTVLEEFSLGDFLLLFIPRDAYAWEAVDIDEIGIQAVLGNAPITATADIAITGTSRPRNARVTVALPATAVLAPDSVVLDSSTGVVASVEGESTVVIELENLAPDVNHQLSLGLHAGLELGTDDITLEVVAVEMTATDASAFTVVESGEPGNNTAGGATPVAPDVLYLSHGTSATDVDFYRLTVPAGGSDVSINLSNLPADFDLVVYGPGEPSIVPTSDDTVETVPDADFDVNPNNDTRPPAPLDDIDTTLDGQVVYGLSYNRGTTDDQVDFLAAIGGDYFIQVGASGAIDPDANLGSPYALRVYIDQSEALACPAATFPHTGVVGTSTPVTAETNTLILFNQERLGRLHGQEAADAVAAKVDELLAMVNGDANDDVDAAVIALDSITAVQNAYAGWDATPCDVEAANSVVAAIAEQVAAIRATNDIDHVMIVGGDDTIPFARVNDATTIANEASYVSSLGVTNTPVRSAFAQRQMLTDDPYGDSAPDVADNRQIYVTEVAVGRLVEQPAEIIASIDLYLASGGQLDPQTGFVAGYDFLDDGSEAVANELDAAFGTTTERLINDTWSADDLAAALAPPADVNSLAAHFDHSRALPALGDSTGSQADLFEIDDLGGFNYSGSIVASMGCHSGLSLPDSIYGPLAVDSRDWAQSFLELQAAVYVGSTGYAYGDDTKVALTERLMTLFARGLGQYNTVGEALLYAKQEYASDLAAYGVYDEKALMESTMFGMTFFSLGNPPIDVTINEPVLSDSPHGPFANLAVSPEIVADTSVPENEYWYTVGDNGDEQLQVVSGYPILPSVELEVTQQLDDSGQLELDARGALIESLETVDVDDVDPATARAVYDLAANEPNTDAQSVTFALAPEVTTYLSPAGVEQQLVMPVGAFETDGAVETGDADGTGTMRLYTDFDLSVYYADPENPDRTAPTFSNVDYEVSSAVLTISADVEDDGIVQRAVALVTELPEPGVTTTWRAIEMTNNGGRWVGSTPVTDNDIEFVLQALDGAGNVGLSVNKRLSFADDGPPPPPTVTILSPADGDVIEVDSGATAEFSCADAGGVPRICRGELNGATIQSGDPVDGMPGTYTLAVSVTDDGYTVTDTITFTVVIPSDCTIVGTIGDDILRGTDGDDVICGFGGDDRIIGGDGDDVIRGGSGLDRLSGDVGDDLVEGGLDDDVIDGGDGNDELLGDKGNDVVFGGDGNDILRGGDDNDLLKGQAGRDELIGDAGFDRLFGDQQRDTCIDDGADWLHRSCEVIRS